jgi:RNA polymerase sigma-70 factor (ECF subfamily)
MFYPTFETLPAPEAVSRVRGSLKCGTVTTSVSIDDDIRESLNRADYLAAFDLLLPRYQNRVFRLAYSMLNDRSAAEELAQDVFLRVWKGLPWYRGESSLSTWIYAITRNQCLMARKKTHAQRAVAIGDPGVFAAMDSRLVTRPDARSGVDIASLIGELPPQYREVITLFYMEEKSYEEVSAMLGLPLGTVKTYLHRARKQLAQSAVRMS